MSLAWVQAIVALFVALMVSLTGLLTSVSILLPVHTGKAERALEQSPKRCLLVGVGMLVVFVLGIALWSAPIPLLKLLGFGVVTAMTGVVTVGGAGMAQLMGKRISEMSGAKTSFGSLVRGSIAYSVAVFFPYIGWFVLAPISILCALGAGVAGMRHVPDPNARPVALPWQPQPAFAGASMMPTQTPQGMYPGQETPAVNSYQNIPNVPQMHIPMPPPAAQPTEEKR